MIRRRTTVSPHPISSAKPSALLRSNRPVAKASSAPTPSALYKSKLGNDLQAALDVYDARVRWIYNRPVKIATRLAGLTTLIAVACTHPTLAAFGLTALGYVAIATLLHFTTRRAAPDQFHFNGRELPATYASLARATCTLVYHIEIVEEMIAGGPTAFAFPSASAAARAPAQIATDQALVAAAEGMLRDGKAVSGALPMSVLCERLSSSAKTLGEIAAIEMPWSS